MCKLMDMGTRPKAVVTSVWSNSNFIMLGSMLSHELPLAPSDWFCQTDTLHKSMHTSFEGLAFNLSKGS